MQPIKPENARDFILKNTACMRPPNVPELTLYLATEAHELWMKTEDELQEIGLPPPFWAFAWAGGQGLARYILDHPQIVRGKTVLDFASGSGIVGLAAAKAGAANVTCADIDPFCAEAITLNANLNQVRMDLEISNVIGKDCGWDVILAGDVFYDYAFASQLIPWFSKLNERGALILVGDPGRSYLPRQHLVACAVYEVPVTRALEDAEIKRTTVWSLSASAN